MDVVIKNKIVIVSGLGEAVNKIEKMAPITPYQSIQAHFNLTWGVEGYSGELKANTNLPPIGDREFPKAITILQEGIYSLPESLKLERDYLTFGDIVDLDVGPGRSETKFMLGKLADQRISRIDGWSSSYLDSYSNPVLNIELYSDSKYFISTRAEKGFAHRFDVHKKRKYRKGSEIKSRFNINPNPNADPLFAVFEAFLSGGYPKEVFFRYGNGEKQTLPYDSEIPFSLGDFAYYSLLAGNPELRLVNECQEFVASSRPPNDEVELTGGLDIVVKRLSIHGAKDIQPLVLDTTVLSNVRNEDGPDYKRLAGESAQTALKSLNKFVDEHKGRFEPTLNELWN